jgi:hypothetical protein
MDCNKWTNDQYKQVINNSMLADATKKNYTHQIDILTKKLGGVSLCEVINNADKFVPAIKDAYPVDSTRTAVFNVLLSVIKHSNIKQTYPEIFRKWYDDHFKELKGAQNAKFKAFIQSDRTVAAAMPWKDIIARYNELARTVPYSLEHLTLAMYTLIPPRRHQDYWRMVLVRADEDMKRVEGDKTVSGYVDLRRKPAMMTVLNYKTKGLYDTFKKELPKVLEVIIRKHLKGREGQQVYLFQKDVHRPFANKNQFATSNNNVLKRALDNPKASVNVIRHAACTYIYEAKLEPAVKQQYALDMGHSLDMQSHYFVKPN